MHFFGESAGERAKYHRKKKGYGTKTRYSLIRGLARFEYGDAYNGEFIVLGLCELGRVFFLQYMNPL